MESGRVASRVCHEMKWLLDQYIIDYFIDSLWEKIPASWRILDRLTDMEWSLVLDESSPLSLSLPLPLSIICIRRLLREYSLLNRSTEKSIEDLGMDPRKVAEYRCLTVYEKRKVKEKKRDEIERVVPILRTIRDVHPFTSFVDIGSGLGHLTRAISNSIQDLSVRGVEGSTELVERAMELDEKRSEKRVERMRVWVDAQSKELLGDDEAVCVGGLHACGDLGPSILRLTVSQSTVSACLLFGCCYHKLNGGSDKLFRQDWTNGDEKEEKKMKEKEERGFPMSEAFKDERLSYAARELACHSKGDYVKQLREQTRPSHLHHAVRALAEVMMVEEGGERHAGVRGVKVDEMEKGEQWMEWMEKALIEYPQMKERIKEKLLSGLSSPRLDQIPSLISTAAPTLSTLYNMRLLVAPFVEDLILHDRVAFLRESGLTSSVVRLFDPVISPRCFALIGLR
ncbi:hypothetical protein PFISCL1PPCAC_24755 [Pristionchus fissidentatus]|uniref:Methyltransferase domain-containing protein n=1 Tax=Pristionchus fissidentatus TaxID=1538716 RepID=A0AAV5WS55_9BILA|nr:hypothetical protein PFISCL1PPCAC_24755 [Pristionchus fissidentatus]